MQFLFGRLIRNVQKKKSAKQPKRKMRRSSKERLDLKIVKGERSDIDH